MLVNSLNPSIRAGHKELGMYRLLYSQHHTIFHSETNSSPSGRNKSPLLAYWDIEHTLSSRLLYWHIPPLKGKRYRSDYHSKALEETYLEYTTIWRICTC